MLFYHGFYLSRENLEVTGDLGWFQLYVYDDLKSGLKLAKRAQTAGYKTLILTVDVPELGRRPKELKHNFSAKFRPSYKQILIALCIQNGA